MYIRYNSVKRSEIFFLMKTLIQVCFNYESETKNIIKLFTYSFTATSNSPTEFLDMVKHSFIFHNDPVFC